MSQKSLRNLKMNKIWGCEHRFAFSKDNVIWLAQEPVIVMHCRLEFTLLISLGYMHCIHRCQIHGLVDHLSLVDPWIAASQKLWISLFLNATVCSSLTWLITHISVSFLSLVYNTFWFFFFSVLWSSIMHLLKFPVFIQRSETLLHIPEKRESEA